MDQALPQITDQVVNLDSEQIFITKVFGWMSLALALSGIAAFMIASSPTLTKLIFGNILIFYALLAIELLEVFFLSMAVKKISAMMASILFIIYAITTGATLSVIFLVYTASSITSTFFVTALTFGAMALYGYTTKRDLTTMGNFLMMGLFGLIIASVINIFWNNSVLYWITTYLGVIIFVGLTAFDMQKIKETFTGNETSEEEQKESIIGALNLYLDFINLFLNLLRILGRKK